MVEWHTVPAQNGLIERSCEFDSHQRQGLETENKMDLDWSLEYMELRRIPWVRKNLKLAR